MGFEVTDVSEKTVQEDFKRNKRIHCCFILTKVKEAEIPADLASADFGSAANMRTRVDYLKDTAGKRDNRDGRDRYQNRQNGQNGRDNRNHSNDHADKAGRPQNDTPQHRGRHNDNNHRNRDKVK